MPTMFPNQTAGPAKLVDDETGFDDRMDVGPSRDRTQRFVMECIHVKMRNGIFERIPST